MFSQSVAMKRASHRQWTLKPQDLAMALKLLVLAGKPMSYAELARSMRLGAARLVIDAPQGRQLVKAALAEFLIHGARYAFPAVGGGPTIGVATASAAAPLNEHIASAHDLPPVWTHPHGELRGQALLPLYEKLPDAALEDPELHQLLALFDALRIGRARERNLAVKLLAERFA
ncbi:MAG: hypothetical protein RQ741_03840 [Wenzhouxiangellaceae bacterium]|nr:hypothetical protein [Wenzhouxiangellaceae bacterium]